MACQRLHAGVKTDNLRALQGSVWIQSSEEVPFSTSYIQGTVSGDLWLTHASDKTMVRHLSGELFLRHRSSTEAVTLPVGFENWYSGLQTDGKPYQGTLKPLPANSFLVEWFKEFKMPVALAKKIWQTWALSWKGNIEVGSEIYQASMERHLASEKLKEQAWANRQEQQHQEAARLRALYRSKNGMDAFHSPTQSPDSRDF